MEKDIKIIKKAVTDLIDNYGITDIVIFIDKNSQFGKTYEEDINIQVSKEY